MIIKHRRGTAAEWTAKNPALNAGEIGFETDTNRFKIGSGVHEWSTLPYYQTTDEFLINSQELIDRLNADNQENYDNSLVMMQNTLTAMEGTLLMVEASKDAAETAANTAQSQTFAGTTLGTADLNTITTPGVYYQPDGSRAQVSANYPKNGWAGSLTVIQWHHTNGTIQTYTPYPHGAAGARYSIGIWQRAKRGEEWGKWSFIPAVESSASEIRVFDPEAQNFRSLPLSDIPLGTADLDTITTPGIYRQNLANDATLARNYPAAPNGGAWVLEVLRSGGGTGGILQRMTRTWSPDQGRGFYERARGVSWGPWNFIPSQRVDNAAGRAIYTWDDTANREQLIYGDTGWRTVTSGLVNGWTADSIRLMRYGGFVTFGVQGLNSSAATAGAFYELPSGFRPAGWPTFLLPDSGAHITLEVRNNFLGSGGGIVPTIPYTGKPNAQRWFYMTWRTTDPWPTTLPGIPSGSIPTL